MSTPVRSCREVLVVVDDQIGFVEFIEPEIAFPIAKLTFGLVTGRPYTSWMRPDELLAPARNDIELIVGQACPSARERGLSTESSCLKCDPSSWRASMRISDF